VTAAGGTVDGEWEEGSLLGEPLVVRGRQVLYAAQQDDGPLLRTITVVPGVRATRAIALYGQSLTVLPGHPVFHDAGAWAGDWDQVQLAPLTGRRVDRDRLFLRNA
jgi:hypothetical protein